MWFSKDMRCHRSEGNVAAPLATTSSRCLSGYDGGCTNPITSQPCPASQSAKGSLKKCIRTSPSVWSATRRASPLPLITMSMPRNMRGARKEDDPLYKFTAQLTITGTSTYPKERAGDTFELTISGNNAPSQRNEATLRDAQARDEHGSPQGPGVS
jgi:hypothetical protein